jgi:hypothetical protein
LYVAPSGINKYYVEKIYPRTLVLCEKLMESKLNEHFESAYQNTNSSFYLIFEKFILKELASLAPHEHNVLLDVFRRERIKFKMDLANESHALTYIKGVVAEQNSNAAAQQQYFKMEDNLRLVKIKYLSTAITPDLKKEDATVLYKSTPYGVQEDTLSNFSHLVLKQFVKPQTLSDAKRLVLRHFGELNNEEKEQVGNAFIEQTRLALQSGILTSV